MNRTDLSAILADLDEVILRLRDAGAPVLGLERERLKLEPRRPSNAELRRDAAQHFAKAREYASEAVRRLRGDR